jgi:hypothetical protein
MGRLGGPSPLKTYSTPMNAIAGPVDRRTFVGLTRFRFSRSLSRRKPLILNGEMSEWLKEHAWKLISLARADTHEIASTHFRSTTSRNNDLLQRVPLNDGVAPGFRGVCDTVLTQNSVTVSAIRTDVRLQQSQRTPN